MIDLLFYTTAGCHLCDLAEQVICQHLDFDRFRIEVIDIAESDQLIETYGVRIPVLAAKGSGAELGWPFDAAQLQAFVQS